MRAVVTQRETVGQHCSLVDSLERECVDFLTRAGFCSFRHVDRKVVGVQWHHERMALDSSGCKWAIEAIGDMIGLEMP